MRMIGMMSVYACCSLLIYTLLPAKRYLKVPLVFRRMMLNLVVSWLDFGTASPCVRILSGPESDFSCYIRMISPSSTPISNLFTHLFLPTDTSTSPLFRRRMGQLCCNSQTFKTPPAFVSYTRRFRTHLLLISGSKLSIHACRIQLISTPLPG